VHIRQALLWFAYVAVAGWFLPPLAGVTGYDTHLFLVYAVLSVFFLTPWMCRGWGVPAGAFLGWFSTAALIGVRFLAARRELQAPAYFPPNSTLLAATLILAAGFAVFGAALAARLARTMESAPSAEQAIRRGLLAAILAGVLLTRLAEPVSAALSAALSHDRIVRTSLLAAAVLSAAAFALRPRNQDRAARSSHQASA